MTSGNPPVTQVTPGLTSPERSSPDSKVSVSETVANAAKNTLSTPPSPQVSTREGSKAGSMSSSNHNSPLSKSAPRRSVSSNDLSFSKSHLSRSSLRMISLFNPLNVRSGSLPSETYDQKFEQAQVKLHTATARELAQSLTRAGSGEIRENIGLVKAFIAVKPETRGQLVASTSSTQSSAKSGANKSEAKSTTESKIFNTFRAISDKRAIASLYKTHIEQAFREYVKSDVLVELSDGSKGTAVDPETLSQFRSEHAEISATIEALDDQVGELKQSLQEKRQLFKALRPGRKLFSVGKSGGELGEAARRSKKFLEKMDSYSSFNSWQRDRSLSGSESAPDLLDASVHRDNVLEKRALAARAGGHHHHSHHDDSSGSEHNYSQLSARKGPSRDVLLRQASHMSDSFSNHANHPHTDSPEESELREYIDVTLQGRLDPETALDDLFDVKGNLDVEILKDLHQGLISKKELAEIYLTHLQEQIVQEFSEDTLTPERFDQIKSKRQVAIQTIKASDRLLTEIYTGSSDRTAIIPKKVIQDLQYQNPFNPLGAKEHYGLG